MSTCARIAHCGCIMLRGTYAKQSNEVGGELEMGIIVGEPFEDYGNAPEYTVSEFRAYERLSGNRVRLYLTEERRSGATLQYTAVVPSAALEAMGLKCLEIAAEIRATPPPICDLSSARH